MKQNLLVIAGPTAVGKTILSIEIAKQFNGEIISGDSMQVYKGMDIGTAKITTEEMQGIPHYLIDCYSPDQYFSVADFQEVATQMISEINSKEKLPIIVGGTGLYIKSVTHQYKFSEATADEEYREYLSLFVEKEGKDALYQNLVAIDPLTALKLHPNDVKRVIRALEVYHSTGKTMSQLLEIQNSETPYNLLIIGLTMDRVKLYERINERVDRMLELGLIDEVRDLLEQGYDESYNSMQGIGYKEVIQYLRGEIDYETTVALIKQGSRNYAKRQLSWFRQMSEINWFDVTNTDADSINKIKLNISDLIAGKFSLMQNK